MQIFLRVLPALWTLWILLTIFMLYDGALVQLKSFGVGQSGIPLSIDGGGGSGGSGGGTGTQCFNSVLTHQLSTHSNGSHHVMNVRIPTSTISSTTRLQSHPLHPLDQQPGTLLCNAVTKITQSRSENDKEDNV